MKELKPQQHPDTKSHYSKIVNGRTILVFADGVDYPANAPHDEIHLAFISPLLEVARQNPSIPDHFLSLLSDSLFYILKNTPDAIGIVSDADYSGLSATSLLKTLKHSVHGKAFAAELIIAGLLITKGSTALSGNLVHVLKEDRMDFGIKMNPELVSRRTIEADVMVHFASGKRIGIDSKYSSRQSYTGRISEQVLTGIANAIHAGEIDEFHFISNVKFTKTHKNALARVLATRNLPSTAINFHEGLWPIGASLIYAAGS